MSAPDARASFSRVVLATGNAGKLREMRALLADFALEIVPQSDLGVPAVAETETTFAGNALLKARHAARATGLPAIADDSGLEVDALGGRPGVYSARYAGENASDADNNAKLLAELADVQPAARTARYRCVIAYVAGADDAAPVIAHGEWEGRIATAPRGDGGFGYDPLFLVDGETTAAMLAPEAKNRVSHRAQALRDLVARLTARRAARRE